MSQELLLTDMDRVHNRMEFKLTGELDSSVNFLDLKIGRDSNQINTDTLDQLRGAACVNVRFPDDGTLREYRNM
jgi:hypothetical protein